MLTTVSREYNNITFLRFLVSQEEEDQTAKQELSECLPLVAKWYDDRVLTHMYEVNKNEHLTETYKFHPMDFEIMTGLLDCVHLVKSGTEMYEFSKPNIYSVVNRPQTYDIVNLFKNRFHPTADHPEKDDAVFMK